MHYFPPSSPPKESSLYPAMRTGFNLAASALDVKLDVAVGRDLRTKLYRKQYSPFLARDAVSCASKCPWRHHVSAKVSLGTAVNYAVEHHG